MTTALDNKVLVLNKSWMPINIVTARDAFVKVSERRALFVDTESFATFDFEGWVDNWEGAIKDAKIAADKVVPTVRSGVFTPEIIVCTDYRGFGYKLDAKNPKFSRRNIYLRDNNQCQYCGGYFGTEDLNLDHVIPKSRGGTGTWTNIVLSCVPCNSTKANRTPKEAGMKLVKAPFVPTLDDLRRSPMDRLKSRLYGKKVPKTWEQFLGKMYWNVELEE